MVRVGHMRGLQISQKVPLEEKIQAKTTLIKLITKRGGQKVFQSFVETFLKTAYNFGNTFTQTSVDSSYDFTSKELKVLSKK